MMGRTCDVCGKELSVLNKFRYEEGFICKECYAKASRQFTETIRVKSFAFRRSFHFAGRICDEMHRLMKEQNDQEGKKEYEAI